MIAAGIQPDRAALEIAHSKLRTPTPIDDMLQQPNLRAVLYALAKFHIRHRSRFDVKRLQANDHD